MRTSDGYIVIHKPTHPRANAGGYVNRSHLVVEATRGKPPGPREVVHHLNGVKGDDRPANLVVLTRADHTALHHEQKDIRR